MVIFQLILFFFLLLSNKIKAQSLNNIIQIGTENCRFSKIANYSNGDLLVSTFLNPGTSVSSYFYGLKRNGRPLFFINGKETPHNYLNGGTINYNTYSDISYDGVGETLIIKEDQTQKEYLFFVGRYDEFAELYDFENNNILYRTSFNVFYGTVIYGIRGSLFKLKESNLFLYAGIAHIYTNGWNGWGYNQNYYTKNLVLFTCYLYQKNSFSSNSGYSNFIKANTASQTTKTVAYGNMVSCFQANDIK